MKTLLTTVTTFFLFAHGHAQNVGIGTNAPVGTLHVAGGALALNALTLENLVTSPQVITNIQFKSRGSESGRISIYDYSDGHADFQLNIKNQTQLYVHSNGNVGIGTTAPTHLLEVDGTMRVVGNMGVGVSTPTARVDLLGTFRYRGSGFPNLPEPGAVLTSVDDDGNAQWQRPVVFKVAGLKEEFLANYAWRKVYFSASSLYNTGFYYDNVQSVFNPPVTGVYHFDVQLLWKGTASQAGLKLVLLRNGSYSTAGYTRNDAMIPPGGEYEITYQQTIKLSTDVRLQPGDQLWVEVHGTGGVGAFLQTEATHSWLNGHLVSRL